MSRRCRPGRGLTRVSGPAAGADTSLRDLGMVTAELAVAMPALVLAGLFAVTGVEVVSAQLRCLDAAGIAARLASRGELPADVETGAKAAAPGDAVVTVSRQGDLESAVVAVSVHPLGLAALLPGFTVSASATQAAEPGAAGIEQAPP